MKTSHIVFKYQYIIIKPASEFSFDLFNFSFIEKLTTESHVKGIKATTTIETTTTYWGIFGSTSDTETETFSAEKILYYHLDSESKTKKGEISIGISRFIKEKAIWELFGGMGYGDIKQLSKFAFGQFDLPRNHSSNYFNADFIETRNFLQMFCQSTLGYSSKITEGAFTLNLSYYNFYKQNFSLDYDMELYEMNKNHILLEPSAHFGAGIKQIKVFLDYGLNIPLTSDVNWKKGNLRFGFLLKI